MDSEKKQRLKELFSSKQFLIALAMCVIVVAVGGYYAYGLRQINKITSPPALTKQQTQRSTQPQSPQAGAPVTGMPDVRTTVPAAAAPPSQGDAANIPVTEAAPAVFSLPLGTDIGMDFSRGEMVFNDTLRDWRAHNGVDFQGAVGDTVKAVAAGTIKQVYDDPLWGTVVEIDHGGGIMARYCGLGRGSTLDAGTIVKMNDTIGNLGTIPCEKDAVDHLHFEVRVNGKITDPLAVLGRD